MERQSVRPDPARYTKSPLFDAILLEASHNTRPLRLCDQGDWGAAIVAGQW